MRSRLIALICLVLIGAATTGPARSVWDGVYTAEQVARGKKDYSSLCARCHGDNLMGNDEAPPLVDKEFIEKWYGKSVGSLVELTQKKMPTDGPGKLTRKQCTDTTAYVLSINGFPAGASELPVDPAALAGILIQPKK